MIRAMILMVLPLPLLAQTAATAMFPPEASCFQRHYSAAHLARHPQQKISEISLTPAEGQAVSTSLVVDISVKLRGRSDSYIGSAYCEPQGDGLSCGMEGDAGAFTLSLSEAGALLLTVDPLGISFEGAQNFLTLSGTSGDDQAFLMHPVAAVACF
ncbi:hypothetical protein GCM10010873_00180 [Cypionkella aquatica]|uniref:Uncharacterized protein n=1 Tax=Cypionkella aquatica TaxID=1756042 RepID=A0AA37TZB7_9RHOB|nr:hypothetical protein [Cypionkella aquatica]GLS85045.1 hypothetical protein GCM10010873_00180 [Cypionkella aquatica]